MSTRRRRSTEALYDLAGATAYRFVLAVSGDGGGSERAVARIVRSTPATRHPAARSDAVALLRAAWTDLRSTGTRDPREAACILAGPLHMTRAEVASILDVDLEDAATLIRDGLRSWAR